MNDRREKIPRRIVVDLISRSVHLPPTSVSGPAPLRELGFDSLRQFQLMLEIENFIGREFTDAEADAVLSCTTVDDLCEVLSNDAVNTKVQSGTIERPADRADPAQ